MNFRIKLSSYFSQRDRGWVLSLFLVVCLVYLPFLGSPFIFDDVPFFSGNITQYLPHALFQFKLQWLPDATLGWTVALFSDVLTQPFRLGNMLLHAANVILLFYLLRLMVSATFAEHEKSSTAVWGAWLGALIFACHPVGVYAVGYVVERTVLMATMFSLITQLAYCRGLLSGQKRWLALAVVAYFFACFSKEHSVMVPALLAAQTILLRTKIVIGKQALWSTWLACFGIAVWVILLAKGVFGTAYEEMATHVLTQNNISASAPATHLLSVLTQAGFFFKYLCLWLLPNPAWMSIDMREPFVASLGAWQGWLGLVCFILYGLFAGRLLFRGGVHGLAGFALLYPWLLFMIEFTSIRVQELFVLYRSYLWMPGMMLLIPLLLSKPVLNKLLAFRLSNKNTTANTQVNSTVEVAPSRRVMLVLGVVALLLVPLAWNRLWVMADNYRLWNDAALLLSGEVTPGADRIFYNRGQAEFDNQQWDAAIEDFKRSANLSPNLAPIHYLLGAAYLNAQHFQEALTQFDAAIELKQDDASYFYAKGLALKRLHHDDLAIQQMKKSCAMKYMMACAIVISNSFIKK